MSEKEKPIVVTVSDEALPDIQRIAKTLSSKGMTIRRVMPLAGSISGSTSPDTVAELEKTAGVVSVADDDVAELPPPTSRRQ